jgi:hypothetical protein
MFPTSTLTTSSPALPHKPLRFQSLPRLCHTNLYVSNLSPGSATQTSTFPISPLALPAHGLLVQALQVQALQASVDPMDPIQGLQIQVQGLQDPILQ